MSNEHTDTLAMIIVTTIVFLGYHYIGIDFLVAYGIYQWHLFRIEFQNRKK